MENGRRMLRRLGSQKLTAVLHCCFAAVVRICRLALALLAAILSILVRLWASQTVERPHEQEYCHEGDDDLQTAAHQISPYQMAQALGIAAISNPQACRQSVRWRCHLLGPLGVTPILASEVQAMVDGGRAELG
jgi:hypothetical protein